MFVTSAQRLTMSDQQQSPDVERQNLLDRLLDAVKQCQVRFGGKTELATDGDSRVTCLLTQFEAVLQHGLKRTRSRISAFRQVGQAAGIVRPGSDSVFWSFVKEHLGKLDIDRFLTLEKATTDGGRGRAWLRAALNEHSLERYFHYMLQNKPLLSQFYERDALMMDEERASTLPMMAAGLSSILFALTVDSDDLNIVRQTPLAAVNKEGLNNFLPSIPKKPVVEPLPVYSSEFSAAADSKVENRKKKKKKKKVHAAIVSIEEDESNLAPLDDTRNFSLNDSSVQDNQSYYRTSNFGHTRSSSYPENKTANLDGSTRQTTRINDKEILFTEISKSVSLPDNSVAKDKGERNPTENSVFDYEGFEGGFAAPGYDTLGEGEGETVTTGAGGNFVFGEVDLFHREAQLEREKTNLSQNNAEGEYSDSNVSRSATQPKTAGSRTAETERRDLIQAEDLNAGEKSTETNRLSAAEGQIRAVTEERSLDRNTSLDSCYSPPVATTEVVSHLNSSVVNVTESVPGSSSEQRFQVFRNVYLDNTNQAEEDVESESDRVEDLDEEMSTSEPVTQDPGLEPVILLDSGESLVPVMQGDNATKASVQAALDYASDLSVEKDRDSASLSSTSWSCIEEAEEFAETKEDLIRASASSDAAAAAAAALAVCSDAQRGMVNMNRGFSAVERTAGDRIADESVNKHEGMSTGELKQAIVSMMLKKDEIEENNRNLDHLLNQERRKSEHLQSEIEELRDEMKRQENRHSGHIASLTRENELLKHQLKKYVGAVQALRSDCHGTSSEAMEVLSRIRQDEVLPPLPPERRAEEMRLSEEADEYKRKLIQVADLHGELIEFNEQLQKRLRFHQHQVRRLREELINLRGPLPEESEVPDDVTKLSDFDPSVMSVGTRPLVNVWIPSVFLRGRSSGVHHVYQVYVRIKDDEWNVYRRYSQFFEMHKDLRRKFPVVDNFKFPPKKTLGNKDSQFVEERKRLLQDYIRRVVNLHVTADRQLLDNTTKPTLVQILPFFGDPYPPEKTKRESTSRRRRSALYTGL